MANQTTKKELLEESLHHHHPEGNEEEVDKEWEEFTRLMAKLKENRRNRPHRPSQAFYPCPLPTPEEEQQDFDPFDYINTIVRHNLSVSHKIHCQHEGMFEKAQRM
ncbi:hypothetical protein HZH68_000438 [Vespula germanica]|uniref:Uncharacterized protein n=1 Tax=Vespula germanica TaxID=30212 RepID=A0A834NTR7_VESGE|nr:hypothetical protein HZH68_000438 [Vespula germanica]